jgi:predicted nucleotidyltransferase
MNPLEQIRKHKAELANDYHVARLGVFGSVARGEATITSDVDILVEFTEDVDIFQFIKLQQYLSDLLGKKVDLVTPAALKPMIKDKIIREVRYI